MQQIFQNIKGSGKSKSGPLIYLLSFPIDKIQAVFSNKSSELFFNLALKNTANRISSLATDADSSIVQLANNAIELLNRAIPQQQPAPSVFKRPSVSPVFQC